MKKLIKKISYIFVAIVLMLTPVILGGCADESGPWYSASKYSNLVLGRDYAYALAVVGDTQYLTQYDSKMEQKSPSKYPRANGYLARQYKWIAQNAQSLGIKYVLGMGDITHNDTLHEWQVAGDAIHQLDRVVPYTIIRGNHDNRTRYYDDIASYNLRYSSQESIISTYPSDTTNKTRFRNTIHKFEACGNKYLIVCLDFGAQDPVLEWANGVVGSSEYADYSVIVTTHAFATKGGAMLDGEIADSPTKYENTYATREWNSGSYGKIKWEESAKVDTTQPFNDGDDIWNKFIKKHANVNAIFCGHVFSHDIDKKELVGDKGNIVHQFVVNPQVIDDDGLKKDGNNNYVYEGSDGTLTGMVALYYFSQDGESVTVRYYSTIKNKYYGQNNQFSFKWGENSQNQTELTLLSYRKSTLAIMPSPSNIEEN